jgi:lipoate-protein ligase A
MAEPAGSGESLLRVIDFGSVTPVRSQTFWHAVAYGVSSGAPPTLSFARPSAPYVCLGYHRSLAEVDLDYCQSRGWPVYRRMVGGGPVYLDDGQLFFQICLAASAVPPSRVTALRTLLAPAVAAFRAAGVTARLDAELEICRGSRKICGHGAGQIEDAVVLCGNLIQRFDHRQATRVLALPDPDLEAETLRLMRRYVAATPADPAVFSAAMSTAYATALGLRARAGELTVAEHAVVTELDSQFSSASWLAGPGGAAADGEQTGTARKRAGPGRAGSHAAGQILRQVKVRAGVWTFAASSGEARVVASVVHGRVARAWLTAPGLNGTTRTAEQSLAGVPLGSVAQTLARFGAPGRQLAEAFAAADRRRL